MQRSHENPFPGLRPYESSDADLFFGREDQVHELLTRLRKVRFLAVLGSSGCGKSSLIRAGLLPPLEGGFMVDSPDGWRIAIMRPGSNPVLNLAVALCKSQVFGIDGDDEGLRQSLLLATLRRGSRGLVNVVAEMSMTSDQKLLILVDQFEELFRFVDENNRGRAEDEARFFVASLLTAVSQSDHAIYVVLTMRSEFLGEASLYPGLADAINRGLYLVPAMSREQLRDAITEPVLKFQGEISNRLVNRLLNDLSDEQDQLPVLQHALMRLWTLAKQETPAAETVRLDISMYNSERIGGMRQTLPLHVKEIMGQLTARQKQIAEIVFRSLTQVATNGISLIRRPASIHEISEAADAEANEVINVIDHFRGEGKSFLMPPAPEQLVESSIIDISHESLIRQWEELRKWTQDDNRMRQARQMLITEAEKYFNDQPTSSEASNKSKFLLTGVRLEEALEWERLNRRASKSAAFDQPLRFLRLSEQLQAEQKQTEKDAKMAKRLDRRNRHLKWAWGVTALALCVAFMALIWSKQNLNLATKDANVARELKKEADEKTEIATRREQFSTGQRLAAASRSVGEERPITKLLYAVEAIKSAPEDETTDGLVQQAFQDAWGRLSAAGIESVALGMHDGPITALVSAQNGERLFTGGTDRTIGFWEVNKNGEILKQQVAYEHAGAIQSINVSDDGRWLVSGDVDGAMMIWQGDRFKFDSPPRPLPSIAGSIADIEFTSDNQWLIVASSKGVISAWHLDSSFDPSAAISLEATPGRVVDIVAFSDPKQKHHCVAIGTQGGSIKCWDMTNVKPGQKVVAPFKELKLKTQGSLTDIAIDADNSWLAAASGSWNGSGGICVWKTQSILFEEGGDPYDVVESEDRATIELEDRATRQRKIPEGTPVSISFAVPLSRGPDAVPSENQEDVFPESEEIKLNPIHDNSQSTDQKKQDALTWIVCGLHTGGVFRWAVNHPGGNPKNNKNRNQEVTVLHDPSNSISRRNSDRASLRKLVVSRGGEWVASSYSNGQVDLIRLISGLADPPIRLWAHEGSLTALTFRENVSASHQGADSLDTIHKKDGAARMVTAGADGVLREWNLASENRRVRVARDSDPNRPFSWALSKDSRTLAVADWKVPPSIATWQHRDGRLWEKQKLVPSARSPRNGKKDEYSIASLQVARRDSLNTTLLAWITSEEDLYFEERPATHDPLTRRMGAEKTRSRCISFSENGEFLAAGTKDGSLHIWQTAQLSGMEDIQGGPIYGSAQGPPGSITCLAFSPDAEQLASAGDENGNVIRIWSIQQMSENRLAKVRDPRELAVTTIGFRELRAHSRSIRRLQFDSAGKTLLSVDDGGTLIFWNLKEADPTPQPVGATLTEVRGNDLQYGVIPGDLSPDGKWIAKVNKTSQLELWSTNDLGAPPVTLQGAEPTGNRHTILVQFSPDGKWLIAGRADGVIQAWSVGRFGKTKVSPPTQIFSNQFPALGFGFTSPTTLHVLDTSGIVREWQLPTNAPFDTRGEVLAACAKVAGRNLTINEWVSQFPQETSETYRRTFDTLPVHFSMFQELFESKRNSEWSNSDKQRLLTLCSIDLNLKEFASQPASDRAEDLVRFDTAWRSAEKLNWKDAEKSFAKLSPKFPGRLDPKRLSQRIAAVALRTRGFQLVQEGKIEKTIELVKDLKAIDPGFADNTITEFKLAFGRFIDWKIRQRSTNGDVEGAIQLASEARATSAGFAPSDAELSSILFDCAEDRARSGEWGLADQLFEFANSSFVSVVSSEYYTERQDRLKTAKSEAGSGFADQARELARNGKRQAAVAKADEAKAYGDAFIEDSNKFVDQLIARAEMENGLGIARDPEKKAMAEESFAKAKQLDPEGYLEIDVALLADRVAASVMLEKALKNLSGYKEAGPRNPTKAREWFMKAKDLDRDLNYEPDKVIDEFLQVSPHNSVIQFLITDSKFDAAFSYVERISRANLEFAISSQSWNQICWTGCLRQQADLVRYAGDAALRLDPTNPVIRDTRGLVRAMTNDVPGAIRDFEFYVVHTAESDVRRKQRQEWVKWLRKGQRSDAIFTSEVLKELGNQ
jgi:WD40 repeat protein/energy-coupling factor transporter ATP-binding protein EcfA2